jgi:hypothetical protein
MASDAKLGIFSDVQWQMNAHTDDGVAIRAGVRIGFNHPTAPKPVQPQKEIASDPAGQARSPVARPGFSERARENHAVERKPGRDNLRCSMHRIIVAIFLSAGTCAGYSKLEALSLIETGNDDSAVGRSGEVSRYQIKPWIWRRYSESEAYRNRQISSTVAEKFLAELEEIFRKRAGREPDDFDLYVRWNAGPTYYGKIAFSKKRVHPIIRERAQRFTNLRALKPRPATSMASARQVEKAVSPKPVPPPARSEATDAPPGNFQLSPLVSTAATPALIGDSTSAIRPWSSVFHAARR